MMRRRSLIAGLTGAPLLARAAAPAAWPTRPVRIIVPFAAGGSVDVMGRVIATRLQERSGQTVTVENRSGASGTIGGIAVSQAAPDGHTLLVSASIQTVARLVMRNPGYDPLTDLRPIARTGQGACLLAINRNRPQTTLAELAEAARTNPREWSFGLGSLGSAGHLATLELIRQIGADLAMAPYRGTAPALADLLGGSIGALMDPVLAMLPPVRSGSLRGLAVTSPRRLDAAPEIPTTAEGGFPSVDVHTWWAVWGPARLPDEIASRVAGEIGAILGEEAVKARLAGLGIQPLFETGTALDAYIAQDFQRAEALLRLAQVQPE